MSVPLKQRDPHGDDENTNTRVEPRGNRPAAPRPATPPGQAGPASQGGQSGPSRPAASGPRPQNSTGGAPRPQSSGGGGQRPGGGGGGQRPGGGGGGQRPGGGGGGQRPGGGGGQRPGGGGGQRTQTAGQRPQGGGQRPGQRPQYNNQRGPARGTPQTVVPRAPVRPRGPVELQMTMTVRELSEALGVGASDILRELIKSGVMATINQQLDYETAALMAAEFGIETTQAAPEEMVGLGR